MSPSDQETDSLGSLEDRIQRAVQLVSRLRQEREAAHEGAEHRAEGVPGVERADRAAHARRAAALLDEVAREER